MFNFIAKNVFLIKYISNIIKKKFKSQEIKYNISALNNS